MALTLPNVPYLNSGIPGLLTPHAVQIHVTKHHQGYITAANNLLKGSHFAGKSVEEIIKAADGLFLTMLHNTLIILFIGNVLQSRRKEFQKLLNLF
jgi:Fe-Mn family superoxide dismutase